MKDRTSPPDRRWSTWTVMLMVIGYAGYYLCRSHFSVAKPLILQEYAAQGINKETLGAVAAWGTAFYAAGKFFFGSVADQVGGRRMFLLGMLGAIAFTLLFGIGGPPLFLMAWIGNRAIQASGWVGMVKITSRWFAHDHYGRVMGFISLSYLLGDFLSRLFLSELIARGVDWHGVFYISAAVLAVIFLPTLAFLRERPSDRGLPEPADNPEALVPPSGAKIKVGATLRPLLTNRAFWTVCVLSFGFTFMRETFNDWTPTYLHEAAGLSTEDAGRASSLFPLFGAISVICVGFLSDRVGRIGRAMILTSGLAVGAVGLFFLSAAGAHPASTVAIPLVAGIAFVLIGPYSLLAGALSLSFGGKQASASAAGWIDGIGYIGGILSGYLIGEVAEHRGWAPAFQLLGIASAISAAVGILYWAIERRRPVTPELGSERG